VPKKVEAFQPTC